MLTSCVDRNFGMMTVITQAPPPIVLEGYISVAGCDYSQEYMGGEMVVKDLAECQQLCETPGAGTAALCTQTGKCGIPGKYIRELPKARCYCLHPPPPPPLSPAFSPIDPDGQVPLPTPVTKQSPWYTIIRTLFVSKLLASSTSIIPC